MPFLPKAVSVYCPLLPRPYRKSRRNRRPAGSSSPNNEEDERQLIVGTLRRRHHNSPPKSIYKSPTPHVLSHQRPSYMADASSQLPNPTDGVCPAGSKSSTSPIKDTEESIVDIDNESASYHSFVSADDGLDAEDCSGTDTNHGSSNDCVSPTIQIHVQRCTPARNRNNNQ